MFYLTTHSTHFIYGYMASDIWLRTIRIVRKETRCRHIGHSFRLTARSILYAPSHRQDNTYHGLCYTSRGALAGTRRSRNEVNNVFHHTRYYGYITPDVRVRTTQIIIGLLFPIRRKKYFILHMPWPLLHQWWSTGRREIVNFIHEE